MVRFINKDLKAHSCFGDEKISDVLDDDSFGELTQLLTWHLRYFGNYSHDVLTHLMQKLTIQLGILKPTDFRTVLRSRRTELRDLFLALELILESFHKARPSFPEYFDDFVSDINDLFLIHRVGLQIRYIKEKGEFYVEKIISPETSEKIGETLENFIEQEKVFNDFKEAIKKYSAGDFDGSIEKCCVAIEDYLCVILNKKICSGVGSSYKAAAKQLQIPEDLDNRFSNIIQYINAHRSRPNHGAIKEKEIEDLESVSEVIIQFTMAILNYLKKKNEK